MHTRTSCLKSNAFTLIELLLSLALIASILFFSIPFQTLFQQKNQVLVMQNDIKSAIRYAKTQAFITGKNMVLTPLQHTNNWSDGMLLFIDNAKHRYIPEEPVIHEWHWESPGIHIDWRGFQSNRYLLFSADASQNAVNGTFLIRNNSNIIVKIVINKLGRIS